MDKIKYSISELVEKGLRLKGISPEAAGEWIGCTGQTLRNKINGVSPFKTWELKVFAEKEIINAEELAEYGYK